MPRGAAGGQYFWHGPGGGGVYNFRDHISSYHGHPYMSGALGGWGGNYMIDNRLGMYDRLPGVDHRNLISGNIGDYAALRGGFRGRVGNFFRGFPAQIGIYGYGW